ncbi:flagellin N-terminal helical domain-containing protein [Virgibacillus sp. FSP13]
MIQTAEGALNETHSILQRMRELATQAANDTNTTDDRKEIQKEMNQLTSEVNRIGNTTEFNTQKLINGDKVATTSLSTPSSTAANATLLSGTDAGTTPATQASGEIASSGITISAVSDGTYDGTAGNIDVEISASSGASAGASYSGGTLTITLDSNNAMDESAINAALQADGLDSEFSISGSGTVSDADSVTLSGGAAAGTSSATAATGSFTISSAAEGEKLTIGNKTVAFFDSTSNNYSNASDAATKMSADVAVDINGLADADVADAVRDAFSGLSSRDVNLAGGDSRGSATINLEAAVAGTTGNSIETSVSGVSTTTGGVNLQIGANENQSLTLDIGDMRAKALGITGNAGDTGFTSSNTVTDGTNNASVEAALDVTSHESASAAITILDEAINSVSAERSKLGAYQNRLDHTINNLGTSGENLTAAESRIRDVDYALAAA